MPAPPTVDDPAAEASAESTIAQRRAGIVCDAIAAAITQGELPVGSRLPPERELMQRFGISRGAVREAIAALAGRGLLETRPGHRPVIRRPDYATALSAIADLAPHLVGEESGAWTLFETRIFMECALARNAALRASASDLEALEAALAANEAAIGISPLFYETDRAFHEVLYRIPRNPIYTAVHQAYTQWLRRHWLAMHRAAEIDRMNHVAHASIYRAIVRRDADQAEQMMRSHLTAAWEHVRPTFN